MGLAPAVATFSRLFRLFLAGPTFSSRVRWFDSERGFVPSARLWLRVYLGIAGATILFAASAAGSDEFLRLDVRLPVEQTPDSSETAEKIEFHDVAGGPEMEFVQWVELGQKPAWRIWSLRPEARSVDLLATLPMPMDTIQAEPLLAAWACPQPGAKEALFVLAPDGGWLLTPDLGKGVFAAQRIFTTPTALAETDQRTGVYPRPIAFDADGDGAAEVLSFSEEAQSLWRRGADGAYHPAPLPPPNVKTQAAQPRIGFFARRFPSGWGWRGDRSEELELSGEQALGGCAAQFQDIDFDGRLDFVQEGPRNGGSRELAVSKQRPDGGFAAPCPTRPPAFDWLPRALVSGPLNFDGDSSADYLAKHSEFSLEDPRTVIAIEYGREKASPAGQRPRQTFRTRDPAGLIWIGDIDGDGIDDLATTFLSYLVASSEDLIDYFLRDEARFQIRTFYGARGQGLPARPDDTLEVKVKTAAFWPPLAPPFDLSGDFNGDGGRDLLLRRSESEIHLHCLDKKHRRFDKRPAFKFSVPENQCVLPLDLDADGKTDLICTQEDRLAFRIYLSGRRP